MKQNEWEKALVAVLQIFHFCTFLLQSVLRNSSWFWDYFIGYVLLQFLYWIRYENLCKMCKVYLIRTLLEKVIELLLLEKRYKPRSVIFTT